MFLLQELDEMHATSGYCHSISDNSVIVSVELQCFRYFQPSADFPIFAVKLACSVFSVKKYDDQLRKSPKTPSWRMKILTKKSGHFFLAQAVLISFRQGLKTFLNCGIPGEVLWISPLITLINL